MRKKVLITHNGTKFSSKLVCPSMYLVPLLVVSSNPDEGSQLTGDFGEVKTAGIYHRKQVLLMTHRPISPILNASVQMTSSRNSGWSR